MAKKKKKKVSSPRNLVEKTTPVNVDRKQARALIISALATSGVFQLNGWQVQAHGNRSSHSVASVQNTLFSPTDYVLLRQTLTEPGTPATLDLAQATEQLRILWERGPVVVELPEFNQLVELRENLIQDLRLSPVSSRVLDFLNTCDPAAAIATIEGSGTQQDVLDQYLWVLLDLAYLGRDGEMFTSTHLDDFMAIAQPAMEFVDGVIAELAQQMFPPGTNAHFAWMNLAVRSAEILHNIASFTLPDDDGASEADMATGLNAAEKALEIRQLLQQPAETMRAHWMVGNHHFRAGDLEAAESSFATALSQAEALGDQAGIAWSKTFLAKVLADTDPAAAAVLDQEARETINGVEVENLMIEFLRIQQRIEDITSHWMPSW